MKDEVFTMVRREQDGMDVNFYADMYYVPSYLLEDSNEAAVLEYFSRIAADYLCTEEGKKELESNSGEFDWNDFVDIPETFLKNYGVSIVPVTSSFCVEVDASSSLSCDLPDGE